MLKHCSSDYTDIGKIKISDVILNKPGRLTSDEFDYMKTHATEGGNVIHSSLSDIEFKRTGKSYSFYTLSELKETYPDLAMLIGGDMVTTFKEWHNYSGILNLCELFVVRRQGIDNLDFDNSVEELRLEGGKITVINADLPDISSTEIREKSKLCVDILSLVPENIVEFIKTTGLYR